MELARGLTAVAATACVLLAQGCGGDVATTEGPGNHSSTPGSGEPTSKSSPADEEPWEDIDANFVLDVIDDGSGGVKFAADPPGAKVMVVASPDAELAVAPGPVPGSSAAAFPSWDQSQAGALLSLAVDPDSIGSAFDPGTADFQFGADVLVPEPPDDEGKVDNGDNLIQRGLYTSTAQLKLQADHGVPSCRVAGSDGEAVVEATRPISPQAWYRLRCQRTGDKVTLFVGTLDVTGDVAGWRTWSITQATGDVDFSAADTPVAIAGKLSPQDALVPASPDQFNGALAHVVYLSR